jgi:lysozyme
VKTSPQGLLAIENREGIRTEAYKDSAGILTIGVGHALTKDELSSGKLHSIICDWHSGLTTDQVTQLLQSDITATEFGVNAAIGVPLNQHQYDALVSFTFNAGVTAFRNSTLVKKINGNLLDEVPEQIRRWVYAGGQKDAILVKRRESEIRQWLEDYPV